VLSPPTIRFTPTTSVAALLTEADNDLQECEALLKRAIEMVRGPEHGSPTKGIIDPRPARVVQIHRDPDDATYVATDVKLGLTVLRHRDSARLQAMCNRLGWQVLAVRNAVKPRSATRLPSKVRWLKILRPACIRECRQSRLDP
jgi:hypothetical protein